jgi:hypothetical protein
MHNNQTKGSTMNDDKLAVCNEIKKLIEITSNGLEKINEWIENSIKKTCCPKWDSDFNYNLIICEYSDRSGNNVSIDRYIGNTEVLKAIKKVLEKQLSEFKSEYERL